MNKLTLWLILAALLMLVGCSKDDSTPVGPVADDQQQKRVETSPLTYWNEWENFDWKSVEPLIKNHTAPVKKEGLKKTTADLPIVTNGGFEDGINGWTTFVTFPGMVDFSASPPVPQPDWAWIVGASDPFGSNTTIYRTGMLHPEALAHSGNAGASAVENVGGIVHRLYQTVTLPATGNLTLEFWIRWKNQYPGTPKWINQFQDIIVSFRNPITNALLTNGVLFKASTLNPPPFSGVGGTITTAFYVKETADVTAFAGQTVRLDFETDARGYVLFVDFDDIAIVQVITNQPPIANAGLDQTEECTTHSGAAVTLDGSGSTDADGDPLTYAWAWTGGSAAGPTPTVTLPLGSHEITLTVDDGKGGTSIDKVAVNVVDTTPPVIDLNGPSEVTLECPATYTDPTAVTDACDPSPTLTAEGTVDGHTPGTYTLNYTARDASGNQSTATRTVKVVDTTPPTIVLSGANPTILECPAVYNEPGAVVTDACDPSPTLTIEGTVDAGTLGTYTVQYTAMDHSGNSATATRTVIVQDTKAPTLSCSVSTPLLWPPNHKFVNVGFRVNVTDACDPNPEVSIRVYSDEDNDKEKGKDKDEDKEKGDDKYLPDAKDIGPGTLQLRAERNGKGDGRVYLIVVTATDKSGNPSFSSCTVVVPHSESKKAIADVNAQAAAAKASSGPNGSPLTPYLIGSSH